MSFFNQLLPLRSRLASRNPGDATDEARTVVPAYNLKETDEAYGLDIRVPGVSKDAVDISVDQDELVVTARRRWKAPEGWTAVVRESVEVDYRLRLDLNEAVDVDKINAELTNGVLVVTLPKAEALKPRKIAVA